MSNVFTDPYQDSYPPSLWGGGSGGGGSDITALTPSSGAVGASFTLTVDGTGFQPGTVISFDGDPRTTTYVSATQLTCPVGALIGPARTVQVTTSTGDSFPFLITAAQEEPEPEFEPPPPVEPEPVEPPEEPAP